MKKRLFEHSYCKQYEEMQPPVKRKSRRSRKGLENVVIDLNMSHLEHPLTYCEYEPQDVGAYVDVVCTYYEIKDVAEGLFNYKEFSNFTAAKPNTSCKVCNIFLFSDQVKHLKSDSDFIQVFDIKNDTPLCSKCLYNLKMDVLPPGASVPNNLFPGDIPDQLTGLTLMEKKLTSQIHSYTTIIILPGGQFAKKACR